METKRLFLINGPNLNLLGKREPDKYGYQTLVDVIQLVKNNTEPKGYEIIAFQSNHEGDLVDQIQKAGEEGAGIILNPAAYTHTSVAIRDAISAISIPVIEVHISNVHQREAFRHQSLSAPVSSGQVVGFGIDGYRLAALGLVEMIEGKEQ